MKPLVLFGHTINAHRAFIAVAFGISNGSAAVFSAATNDLNPTAIVAGLTMIAGAILGAVKLLTPAFTEAIQKIGAALAELQKQREEINKGGLSGQIAQLQGDISRMQERVEDANEKLHDANNKANAVKLDHEAEVLESRATLEALRGEIASLRDENRKLREQLDRATSQVFDASRRLEDAARHVDDLTAEVERLRLGAAHQAKVVTAAVERVAERVEVNSQNIATLAAGSNEFPAPSAPAPPEGETPENRHSQP